MSPAFLVAFLCTNAGCAASKSSFIWAWCSDANAQAPSSMQFKYVKASKTVSVFVLSQLSWLSAY